MAIDLLLLHYNGKLCSINMESNFFIILGNQLFNPKILNKNNCNEVFMAEDLGLCTYFKHHKAKLYLFLTAMREYRDELTKNSIKVNYFKLDERDDNDKYSIFLAKFLKSKKINHIHMFEIEDKEFELYKYKLNLLNPNDLKLWKINQAIPSLEMEINGKNNPLELGLQDLIDFNKGCYLGQETMSKIKNVSSLKQEIRTWKSLESNLNLDVEDKNLYINSAKDISVGKITSFLKSDFQIKGLAMIKRKYLEEESYFFSEIFGKIIINKSVGSIFL